MTLDRRGGDGAGVLPLRHRRGRSALSAGLGLVALVSALAGCAGTQHPGASRPASAQAYGTLPSFLPTNAIRPDSVLVGTSDRPALTTEGDAVEVRIGSARVRATVSGPVVPGEGLPVQTDDTTCTWTVTLSDASSTVPVRLADFTSLDHLGVVYRVAAVPGAAAVPAAIVPGRTASFEVRAVMPTGEGLMRWAPAGGRVLASWDFEVEND